MAEYDVAIEYIFGLMKDGTLKVGDKLPTERAIAAELGIGRNKAREALSILSGMGMIESRQGSGNFVSGNASGAIKNMIIMMMALNTISRQEVCKFRRDMEKAVCSSLISNPPSEEIKNRIKDTLRAMDGLSGEELAKADHDFHNALVKATGNKLWEVMISLMTTSASAQAGSRSIRSKAAQNFFHMAIFSFLISEVWRWFHVHHTTKGTLCLSDCS